MEATKDGPDGTTGSRTVNTQQVKGKGYRENIQQQCTKIALRVAQTRQLLPTNGIAAPAPKEGPREILEQINAML